MGSQAQPLLAELAFDFIAQLTEVGTYGQDYLSHVCSRADILREYDFEYDYELLAASYLLDVCNHGVTYEELEKRFSTGVAQLVYNHGRDFRRTAIILADLLAIAERLKGSPLVNMLRSYYETTHANLKQGDELMGMWYRLDYLMGAKPC